MTTVPRLVNSTGIAGSNPVQGQVVSSGGQNALSSATVGQSVMSTTVLQGGPIGKSIF